MRFSTVLILGFLTACKSSLPEIPPVLITERVPHDSDDPAIWVNRTDPAKSLVFGTDKDYTDGGVFAFDLNGKIQEKFSLSGLSYPNNADIGYDFVLDDSSKTDLLIFTEREKHQIRIFSLPDMRSLDKGGIPVFEDATDLEMRKPMGVSWYKDPASGRSYVIVSRKTGPREGYLYQYEMKPHDGGITARLVRKFGQFSGHKEIEAIAVDHELGFLYYSDEGFGIRKYYADPEKGDTEISLFGGEHFKDDIEGICILKTEDNKGYLIVSNQGDNSFNVFKRDTNSFVKKINLGTKETDGCDIATVSLGEKFPNGLLVTMNDEGNFFFHDPQTLGLEK